MANLIGRIKNSAAIGRVLYRPLSEQEKAAEGGLTGDQKQRLREYYREDVEHVGRIVGRDLSTWLR
jgi:hypothetical protein